MKKVVIQFGLLALLLALGCYQLAAQIETSSSIVLIRGKLWQTYNYGKSGPPFSDWNKRGAGLDWPGFDATLINADLGGSASYLVSGGLIVGAKWSPDSVISVDDWSMYAGSIAELANAKYIVTMNKEVYPNGGNFWVKTDRYAGEQVFKTVWEYNKNFYNADQEMYKRILPVRVTRTIQQWSGSKLDENYIIVEYVIKNISPEIRAAAPGRFVADTMYDFYAVANYGLHCNSRAWNVLFPTMTPGARNTQFAYQSSRRMIYGNAADEFSLGASAMDFAPNQGPIVNGNATGEYLSPGVVGVSLLYSSPDKTGLTSHVNQFGWSAASSSQDQGPFTNIPALPESQYPILKNIQQTYHFVNSTFDSLYMKKSRMWSLMSLGPWTIKPGDSIRIVLAEMVDGVDYAKVIDPKSTSAQILDNRKSLLATADRAQFTFNNKYSHPNPPAAPAFTVDYNRNSSSVANIIQWNTDAESVPDAHDGFNTLAGYLVYRSGFLPIGPWVLIDTVLKGDTRRLSGTMYTYIDSTVAIGYGYYYALTAFNRGRTSWSEVTTPPSSYLQPMESSIFANRTRAAFIATQPPMDAAGRVLVVPNPFTVTSGYLLGGADATLQFVNLPNPCTIRIYTIRGDLVKTIDVPNGAGAIANWDQVSDYGQFVKSGMYVFHLESPVGTQMGKFAIIR